MTCHIFPNKPKIKFGPIFGNIKFSEKNQYSAESFLFDNKSADHVFTIKVESFWTQSSREKIEINNINSVEHTQKLFKLTMRW